MSEHRTIYIEVPEGQVALSPLWGPQDMHRHLLERSLGVRLNARGKRLHITGLAAKLSFAERAIGELLALIRSGAPLFLKDVEQAVQLLSSDEDARLDALHGKPLFTTADRRSISPKTPNQRRYIEAMQAKDLVFSVGPAGTGKTYLAMAAAVEALRRHEVNRIILTRPAVEAGERLGFLPGSLVDKVNPYLRPLYDALFDLLGVEHATKLIEERSIEVAPLAFMRGRTLNKAFVILDEAQNTTREQMKMFLTRLGYASRAVVTGDVTQTDLPQKEKSGLVQAVQILDEIESIGIIRLTRVDVVRHPLVQAIIQAYDEAEA
ncbi:PhoH family protein [Myxococcota bacterium]|nr:PhoH family protein [Myxococcota bacterium]MBU1433059.1 PhoH family protein [Myxococcota bacterium]MBU1898082.1 PhoH family protein [Myxococcota bacterium]